MWEAIAEQVRKYQVRYVFGCGSLYTTDVAEVSSMFTLLKSKYYASDALRVLPVEKCRFQGLSELAGSADEPALWQKLPSLIKGYLRVGAQIAGPPALDVDFGTADFFLLLDFASLKGEYLKRLGLADVKVKDAPA
jgi:putative hemolysin